MYTNQHVKVSAYFTVSFNKENDGNAFIPTWNLRLQRATIHFVECTPNCVIVYKPRDI